MGSILLGDGEDLLARFRPHPASYLGRYLLDAIWLAYGFVAWGFHRANPAYDWTSLAAFVALCLGHVAVLRLLKRGGAARPIVWGLAALGLMIAIPLGYHLRDAWIPLYPPALGVLATALGVAATEFDRLRRIHHLTSRRILLRTGIGRLTERSVDFDRIETVQSSQGALGQMFGYAHLGLVYHARGKKREGKSMTTEELVGVPNWQVVKHQIETALAEQQLPAKERQKRVEERRLRESMRVLAQWTRTERA